MRNKASLSLSIYLFVIIKRERDRIINIEAREILTESERHNLEASCDGNRVILLAKCSVPKNIQLWFDKTLQFLDGIVLSLETK